MPKFTEDIVDKVIELLKTEQFQNCLEISDYLKNTYGIKISRRTIGDINRGDSHRRDHISYPISKKYARNFLTTCCICGKKSEAIIDGKEYCHRHYMQMYHHGEILKETIYDPNEFIEYDDYVAIILKNQYFEPIAITKVDKEDWPRVKQYK